MTVAELISALQRCDPKKKVRFHVSWESAPEINEVCSDDGDDSVTIGHDLPPEVYAMDYKYDER